MNTFQYAVHLAENIPGARLVALDSDNHIVLADEPAWQVFVDEVGSSSPRADRPALAGVLSPRELEVLRLVADGRDNDEIAAALHLSPRTVERHLQNVYGKLGLSGRSARVAAAARLLAAGLTRANWVLAPTRRGALRRLASLSRSPSRGGQDTGDPP